MKEDKNHDQAKLLGTDLLAICLFRLRENRVDHEDVFSALCSAIINAAHTLTGNDSKDVGVILDVVIEGILAHRDGLIKQEDL